MLKHINNRTSGCVVLLLLLAASGCQTTSRQQKIACDFVVDPDIPEAAILSPTLEIMSGSEPALPLPLFVSIEMGEYKDVPKPCRPRATEPIAQIQWRPKQQPLPAKSEQKKGSHSGSKHVASIRTSTETASPPPLEFVSKKATSPDNCLPMLTEWKQRVDSKSLALESELVGLRQTLMLNQKLIFSMKKSLTQANLKIDSMTTELTYYRKEIGRLEAFMQQQHSEDIVVLDELSKQLGNLLRHTTAPVPGAK